MTDPAPPTITFERRPNGITFRFGVSISQELVTRLGRMGCASMKSGAWLVPEDDWQEVAEALEVAGWACVEGKTGKPTPEARKAAARAVAADMTPDEGVLVKLTDLDWSGLCDWAPEHALIQDKQTGELIPFIPNHMQRRLIADAWDQWTRTGRVRMNVVKHRRWGGTSIVTLLFFFIDYHVQAVDGLVMSHEGASVKVTFDRIKLYEATCQPRRPTKANNATILKFKEPHLSSLRIALSSDARGGAYRCLLADELAHWGDDAGTILSGVASSVPDAPGTIVFRMSTSRGVSGVFYEGCRRAEKKQGQFENWFVGSLEDPTCRLYDVPLDDPRFDSIIPEWIEDEPRLRELAVSIGLDDRETVAYLAWRRDVGIPERCEGFEAIYKQEFPATYAESFLSTGSQVFPPSIVDPTLARATDAARENPPKRYRIVIEGEGADFVGTLVADSRGPLRVWKTVEEDARYIIPGDIARGGNMAGDTKGKLDYTTFGVINELTYEEVAVWHSGSMDPDEAAYQMAHLGRMYSQNGATAQLVPEASGIYGPILINRLVKNIRAPRVFRKEVVDKPTRDMAKQDPEKSYMEYGWWTGSTNNVAKATMAANLNALIRDRKVTENEIHDPIFWDEARTFVWSADGRSMDAESGHHDDCISRWTIAATILHAHPQTRQKAVEPERRYVVEDDSGRVSVNVMSVLSDRKKKREAARGDEGDFR